MNEKQSSEKRWYCAKNGERFGPYTLAQIKTYLDQDRLSWRDQIWDPERKTWLPLTDFPNLQEHLAPSSDETSQPQLSPSQPQLNNGPFQKTPQPAPRSENRLILCPTCFAPMFDTLTHCPTCGADRDDPQPRKSEQPKPRIKKPSCLWILIKRALMMGFSALASFIAGVIGSLLGWGTSAVGALTFLLSSSLSIIPAFFQLVRSRTVKRKGGAA